ncbi:helix-turn-helix domain-containing protein [Bacillus pinisoli]|uniref:helix-turn-helix domain-containing protein n=1 Tax=Bacillus pinisoli TaxID=2901866 RepID=UPI001FF3F7F0|nr:helix-turn-helix transcriptional regulator [Bacillus pinisoli]
MSEKDLLFTKLIGEKIREKRQEMAETQDAFADKLGIHVNNYGNIERGVNLPGGQTIIRLITKCGIDMTELVLEADAEAKRVFPEEE